MSRGLVCHDLSYNIDTTFCQRVNIHTITIILINQFPLYGYMNGKKVKPASFILPIT